MFIARPSIHPSGERHRLLSARGGHGHGVSDTPIRKAGKFIPAEAGKLKVLVAGANDLFYLSDDQDQEVSNCNPFAEVSVLGEQQDDGRPAVTDIKPRTRKLNIDTTSRYLC